MTKKVDLAPPIIHVITKDEDEAMEMVLDLVGPDDPKIARVERVGKSQGGAPIWKGVYA